MKKIIEKKDKKDLETQLFALHLQPQINDAGFLVEKAEKKF